MQKKQLAIGIVIALAILITPASAAYNFDGWPLQTRTSGTVNGGVFIDYVPWDGSRDLSLNTTMPNGTVKWAYLYTGIWGGNENNQGRVNVTFNGVANLNGLGPIHLQGKSDTNLNVWCTTYGKHWMFYNVTDLVNASATNTARVKKINETAGAFDGRVYGIVLVVIYEGGDNPKTIQYWLNDGNDALHYDAPVWPPVGERNTGNTYFNGTFESAHVTSANLTLVHLTAYEPACSTGLMFNNHLLDTSMVDSNTFELNTWNVSPYLTPVANNAWYSRCEDEYINVPLAILTLEDSPADKPDLIVTAIKPYHYKWSEEYGLAMGEPYFNLVNYVNVTVRNNGTATAENFDAALYADGELIGSETIADLGVGKERELRFAWSPEGEDPLSWIDTAQGAKLTYRDTNRNYTLSAVADEDEEVQELNETNNELTKKQKVVWNGYAADQPLEVYAHDEVHGGVIVTTGDAVYRSDDTGDSGTIYGKPYEINYNLQIPGSPKLARFYLSYTWAKPKGSAPKAPKIRVTLKNPGGSSADLNLEKSYNDIKGDFSNYRFHAWGTYAYDFSNYVQENGTYVVTVENLNDGSDADFTTEYSFAAPAMLVVYENQTAPKREYWLTEGADILMGGRETRPEGGFLGLEECRNRAEFAGDHLDLEVASAVVGVVSPWADDAEDDLLEFNGVELGSGLYNGYFNAWCKELSGLFLEVGADEAQQGVVVTDITRYLDAADNELVQGDDGDCMMPSNAFLVITYKDELEYDYLDTGLPQYPSPSIAGVHTGTLEVTRNMTIRAMQTYPCPGTGGHTEYVRISGPGINTSTSWDGYRGDWHNLTFDVPFTLEARETYTYEIRTGSYPQIHHQDELRADGGIIRCLTFTDLNGREHDDWIPAFKLY